jgi:inner membrane transporter RhtA
MAMLATAVPYVCDYIVLRRMPQQVYGALLSLEPAVAALLGLTVLGETLGAREWLAVGLVVTAAASAAASSSRTGEACPTTSV